VCDGSHHLHKLLLSDDDTAEEVGVFGISEMNRLDSEVMGEFLLEVDRLKSDGRMTDVEILMEASWSFIKVGPSFVRRSRAREE
jgi:hypothetical protein